MSEIISVPGKCVGDDSYANGWNKCREAYLPLLAGRDARIVELEGLLNRVKVSLSLDDTEWGYSATEKYKLLADIRASLSAGKEVE